MAEWRGAVKAWVVLVVVAGLTVFSAVDLVGWFWHRARDFKRWPKASATLVRYDRGYKEGGHHAENLYRVYRYQRDGRVVDANGPNVVQSFALHDIPEGATVQIAYNPDKPDEVLSRSDVMHVPSRVGLTFQLFVLALGTVGAFRYAVRRR